MAFTRNDCALHQKRFACAVIFPSYNANFGKIFPANLRVIVIHHIPAARALKVCLKRFICYCSHEDWFLIAKCFETSSIA
jgi:hypothetical protein